MTDDTYNNLAYLIAGMKGTIDRMKNLRRDSCNSGKYPPRPDAY